MLGTFAGWESSTPDVLDEARRLVAHALRHQAEDLGDHPSLASLDPRQRDEIERFLAEVPAEPKPSMPMVFVNRRSRKTGRCGAGSRRHGATGDACAGGAEGECIDGRGGPRRHRNTLHRYIARYGIRVE